MQSKFDDLRRKVHLYLPQSQQTIVVAEPLAKQRINLVNRLFALFTVGDANTQQMTTENIKSRYLLIKSYIDSCILETPQKTPTFDEYYNLILPVIELLATLNMIETNQTCKHCGKTQKIILTYDLGLFSNPEQNNIAEIIRNIRENFEIYDPIAPLEFILPEKSFDPKQIEKPYDNFTIRITVGYPLITLNFEDMINPPIANFEYIHSLYIFENGPQEKVKLMYNAQNPPQNNPLRELPESLTRVITRFIQKEIEPFARERISVKYTYTCQECGSKNTEDFNAIDHFFGSLIAVQSQ